MTPDKITELIRNYRAYRYAVNQYEKHRPHPAAGTANYDVMPSGSGAPEFFFDRVGKPADMGHTSFQDAMDYEAYKSAVDAIDGAMHVLTDEEASIMRLKWMDDVDLYKIAQRKHMTEITVRRIHKRAMTHMKTALRFYRMPNEYDNMYEERMEICSHGRAPKTVPHRFKISASHEQL